MRNSKSLPRLPSSPAASPDLSSRFHPSSTMFPASNLPATSISLLSLPAAVSAHTPHKEFKRIRVPLNSDDDNVFMSPPEGPPHPDAPPHVPSREQPRMESSTRAPPLETSFPCSISTAVTLPPDSLCSHPADSPHEARHLHFPSTKPLKPTRHKLSTISSPPTPGLSLSTRDSPPCPTIDPIPPPVPPKPDFLRSVVS